MELGQRLLENKKVAKIINSNTTFQAMLGFADFMHMLHTIDNSFWIPQNLAYGGPHIN